MTIDEAMYGAENPITLSYSRAETALIVLAAEVRRLHTAIEAVKALPYLDWDAEPYRDDVLTVLEAE